MLRSEIFSDDTLGIDIVDSSERAAVAKHLRIFDSWSEGVEGMNYVIVQFDSSDRTHDAGLGRNRQQLWHRAPAEAAADLVCASAE